jgi:hypothetical protein
MKLEEIRVESFETSGGEVNLLPTETYNDATAGCCNSPPFTYNQTCTCVARCL